ncbi:MAG: hypothetical protein JOZ94_10895 [Xanthobacteraceae bacterium]|nr:hypothetical protein [Xanthobacteraceae bacterium]MBV9632735.1 hypothetical protein [Xanthobacteraceae bacterium]
MASNAFGKTQHSRVAVCYLARGAEPGWEEAIGRFMGSLQRHAAGCEFNLHVIFKGFPSAAEREGAMSLFASVQHNAIFTDDKSFDIGAYAEAATQIAEQKVCFLNTNSEILCGDWLVKLVSHLDRPGVGLVGATGSYESLRDSDPRFPKFPNMHIRSNAFMIDRDVFATIAGQFTFTDKLDAFLFESGPNSMTRQIRSRGLEVLVVGRNGQGYPPRSWPRSDTFRQGGQANLLIGDNQTRHFDTLPLAEQRALGRWTWGRFLPGSGGWPLRYVSRLRELFR